MNDATMAAASRTPVHLWIVGVLAILWNAYGCFDYVMTQTGNAEYLAQFTAEQRAYFESFPAWMEAAWAIGVWGALLGSLLLLARSRHAVLAFEASLAGLLVSTVYQFGMAEMPGDLKSVAMVITGLVWLVAIGLLIYAMRMRGRGVLR